MGIAAFVASTVLILWIFPREAQFRYEFQQGAIWQHTDLYAPFDYPIRKTGPEIEAERKAIVEESKPYLLLDTNVFRQVRKSITLSLDSLSSSLIPEGPGANSALANRLKLFRKQMLLVLDSIYLRGILEPHSEILQKPLDQVISLGVSNNLYKEYLLGDFHTPQSAQNLFRKRLYAQDSVLAAQWLLPVLDLSSNIRYDKETTERFREEALRNVLIYKGALARGNLVISKGEYIDADNFNKLESLRLAYNEERGSSLNYYAVMAGQLLFISFLLAFLFSFLNIFRQKLFRSFRQTLSILVLLLTTILLARATLLSEEISIYMVPFAILPILVRSFFDTRLALFVHIISILISAYLAPNSYEFVIIQMGGGITAIFSFVNLRKRQQIFNTVILVFGTYSLLYIALILMREGTLMQIEGFRFLAFLGSCMITLFVFPLIYIFEKLFGLLSDVTLLELSDTNSPLLKQLSAKAPGTFQHSMQVANLAEAAMDEIGGNALLVRTGALYHDIGKMEMGQYFIENQINGVNPHNDLPFEKSAGIIISHVAKGVAIAKENRLPQSLIDFIRTHHGTQTVQYFYRNYLKNFPDADQELDKKKFSYPDPIPFSRETAVLMMADSVEAASRSISAPDMHKINELVEKIINYQMAENQLVNSDITLRDIRDVKRIFKEKLMNIYHIRIEYPEAETKA